MEVKDGGQGLDMLLGAAHGEVSLKDLSEALHLLNKKQEHK